MDLKIWLSGRFATDGEVEGAGALIERPLPSYDSFR